MDWRETVVQLSIAASRASTLQADAADRGDKREVDRWHSEFIRLNQLRGAIIESNDDGSIFLSAPNLPDELRGG